MVEEDDARPRCGKSMPSSGRTRRWKASFLWREGANEYAPTCAGWRIEASEAAKMATPRRRRVEFGSRTVMVVQFLVFVLDGCGGWRRSFVYELISTILMYYLKYLWYF